MERNTNDSRSRREMKTVPLVTVILSGAFIALLSQTLLGTALPRIMNDLRLSANTAQWLTSAVLLVVGIMVPVTAFLIGKFTTRQLFLTAIGSFAAGTLVCATAPGFPLLLAGRVIQAAGAGIMIPLMQTILFVAFPVERRGTMMGIFGLVITLAPAIGPTLAGWLVDHYPWRSLFWLILPIAVLDLAFAYFFLGNVTEQNSSKVDIPSILTSTLGFGGILYGFSSAGTAGWANVQVLVPLAVGTSALIFFVWRQLKLARPMLEFRVFRFGIFALSTGVTMIIYTSMIGATAILPIYMQNMRHFSATESGLMMLPGALAMGTMSLVSGRLFDKLGASGAKRMAILGVGMVMTPMTTLAIGQLPKALIPHGTAMNNTMRQVAGAIGTAVLITVMTSRAAGGSGETSGAGFIQGVNASFLATALLAALGVVLSLFLKQKAPAKDLT